MTAQESQNGDANLVHFVPAPLTQIDISFANLIRIDLSTYNDGSAAQQRLADQIYFAMTTQGFFVLTGFGISEEEIQRQVDIGYTVIEKTPLEEKKALKGNMDYDGIYRGFKLRQYYEMQNGVKDQIEQFNWQREMDDQPMPSTITPFLSEVHSFCERVHKDVLFKVYRLFALALQVPSETFVDKHKYEEKDDSWFRYMTYYDEHKSEDEEKTGGVWLKGHQDHTTLTMVFSQPMASLQVRDAQGHWTYAPHVPGGIIINCGSSMEWWTGGLFKSAIHRVAAPPADQRNHVRCGVYYFSIPNNDVHVDLLKDSPVLQRAGVKSYFKDGKTIDALTFSRARIAKIGKSSIYKEDWGAGEIMVENIAGVEIPHYG